MTPDWVVYLVVYSLVPVAAVTVLTARDAWSNRR